MKRLLKTSLAIAVLAALTQVASAITVQYNLGQLMAAGASIQIGDKIFGDWSFHSAFCTPYDVTISPVGTQAGGPDYYGIIIQGPFTALNDQLKDFGINYTVAVAPGSSYRIHDILQAFNGSGDAGGLVRIDEDLYDQGFGLGNNVAHSSLVSGPYEDKVDPPGELTQRDILLFPSVTKVWVMKDIYVYAPLDGVSSATMVVQRFSQEVPDGGWTLLLLGSAFTGLTVLRRKLG